MDRRTAIKNMALSLGFAVSGSTVISLFNACSNEKSALEAEFFKAEDMHNINFLTEIILPTTSTPGAKELNIAQFVDKMCQHVLGAEKQQAVVSGAAEYARRFEQHTGIASYNGQKPDHEGMIAKYFDLSENDEKSVLKMLATEASAIPEKEKSEYNLYSFLTTVRELSMLGYFTSETVVELA